MKQYRSHSFSLPSCRVFHGYTTGREFRHRTHTHGYCTHHGYGYIPYCKSCGVIQNLWYLLYPQVIYITNHYKDTIVCKYWLLDDLNVQIWLLPLSLGVCFHSSNNIFKKNHIMAAPRTKTEECMNSWSTEAVVSKWQQLTALWEYPFNSSWHGYQK